MPATVLIQGSLFRSPEQDKRQEFCRTRDHIERRGIAIAKNLSKAATKVTRRRQKL
jgi:hypothetical protein